MRILLIQFGILFFSFVSIAQSPATFENPIIPGFHPDPSICRVGDDYYLVTSSFEWFPGVPIYHSKDLVNWQQIGNVLSRPEQLNLEPGHRHNGGIWAPTIRYHNGLFYMITTCAGQGNFYVMAEHPAGPWSDPVWLKQASGIDPSLYWDEDGRCWYTGAANVDGKPKWTGQNGVYIQELDLEKQALLDKPIQMTHGHATNARYTEGPHIYKIDNKYLLLVAEGGTGKEHAITVFESDSITGPYTPSHTNPVLTHRHLGKNYPIGMVGHGDLVQTQTGEWWAVLLGRRVRDNLSMLARETFLVPVQFEDGWPLFSPGFGKVPEVEKRPDLPWHPFAKLPARDDFDEGELGFQYNFLRTPKQQWHTLYNGTLGIQPRPVKLTELDNPSMICRRIQHFDYQVTSQMEFKSNMENEAGLTVFLDNTSHYRLAMKKGEIQLIKVYKGDEQLIASKPYTNKNVVLQIEARYFDLIFRFGESEEDLTQLGDVQDAKVITAPSFIGTGFNGPYTGMYAVGELKNSPAFFNWFEYLPKSQDYE